MPLYCRLEQETPYKVLLTEYSSRAHSGGKKNSEPIPILDCDSRWNSRADYTGFFEPAPQAQLLRVTDLRSDADSRRIYLTAAPGGNTVLSDTEHGCGNSLKSRSNTVFRGCRGCRLGCPMSEFLNRWLL